MLMQRLLGSPTFRVWLALVGVATLIIGASYAMAQQSTRLSADDLPLTTLQVAKQELQNGSNAKDVVPTLKTNLRNDNLLASHLSLMRIRSQLILGSRLLRG
jgi:hypothetical protein